MTEKLTYWYHCGKCGDVYNVEQDEPCPACVRTALPLKKKATIRVVDGSSVIARKEFVPKHIIDNTPTVPTVEPD